MNKDRQNKEEILRLKREEVEQREQELQERFALAEKSRNEIDKRLTKIIEEKAGSVQQDISMESRNR